MTITHTTYHAPNQHQQQIAGRQHQATALVSDYMTNSFYLPKALLRHGGWLVAPIKVITGDQFRQLARAAGLDCTDAVNLCYEGATYNMLVASTSVGISERTNLATGKKYLICKAWQGDAK